MTLHAARICGDKGLTMEYTEEVVTGLLASVYLCFSENCVGVNGDENQTFKGLACK